MFPLRDTLKSQTTPVINWLLILLNAAVFGYEVSLPPEALERFLYEFGLVPERVFASLDDHWGVSQWWTVLSGMFLHAGWLHIISNMWMLVIFGDNVEDRMGHLRYLVFYLVCGAAAGLLHLYTNASSDVPAVGASGAIAGIMGGYFLLFPHARILAVVPLFIFPWFVELPAFLFLLFWFLTQLFSGTVALNAEETGSGIAWWAHIGGFAAGALLLVFFVRNRRRPVS